MVGVTVAPVTVLVSCRLALPPAAAGGEPATTASRLHTNADTVNPTTHTDRDGRNGRDEKRMTEPRNRPASRAQQPKDVYLADKPKAVCAGGAANTGPATFACQFSVYALRPG